MVQSYSVSIEVGHNSQPFLYLVNNFAWRILQLDAAQALFMSGTMDVYELYDDGSESLIRDWSDFDRAKEYQPTYAIEGGHLKIKITTDE